jgi:hypothetical protein
MSLDETAITAAGLQRGFHYQFATQGARLSTAHMACWLLACSLAICILGMDMVCPNITTRLD